MLGEKDKLYYKLVNEYKEKLKQINFAEDLNLYDALKLSLSKIISDESDDIQYTINDLYNKLTKGENRPNGDEIHQDELNQYKIITQEPREENEDVIIQDFSNLPKLFNNAGEGLPMEEYLKIKQAINKIIKDHPIDSIRFWGKIFGTSKNYFIIECQPGDPDAFQETQNEEVKEEISSTQEALNSENRSESSIPKFKWKPPPEIPAEEIGEGANNRVYFVSNQAHGPYTLLPSVKPVHIFMSRMIRNSFTGDLHSKLVGWPQFSGTEADYLRAQIARISSGTILAPKNFFQAIQEEEELSEDEEAPVPIECEENEEYQPAPIETMNLTDWVHSRPYILPQGRVTWINPKELEESENEESESEETSTIPPLNGLEEEPIKRERGPPILTPISHDIAVDNQQPWKMRKFNNNSHLLISSLLWPGAHTAAKEGSFENIYIGWGLKAVKPRDFPYCLPRLQTEFLQEIDEIIDPTPEEEQAQKAKDEEGSEAEEGSENDEDDEN